MNLGLRSRFPLMPIKFRCQHCRQFLGISRAKAEQVVDCPTCGRSIRVPSLDGRVAPLPQPKLDLQDDSLVDALDRLAAIGDQGSQLVLAGDEVEGDESDDLLDESLDPVVVPEVRTAPPPKPIDPPPLPKEVAQPIAVPVSGPPADPFAAVSAALPAEPPSPPRETARPPAARSWWPVLVTAIVAIGAGFVAGRMTAPGPEVAEAEPEKPSAPAAPVVPHDPAVAVTGIVTYKTTTGDRPDEGACVIALPAVRRGVVRLPVAALRPGASGEDWAVGRASLRALGGDAAIVDREGQYDLRLPEAGTYHLLVVSRHSARPTDEPIPSATVETLAKYFDNPGELIGDAASVVEPIRWTGTDVSRWNHPFPAIDG